MLRQQISGIVNLSLPLIIVYAMAPVFLLTWQGQIICSLALGFYLWLVSYQGLMRLTNTLQFSPTGHHKDAFENMMRSCNVDPDKISLKYAYTNESIAMTANKTIVIDPILWHGLLDDPQAVKIEEIYKVHIEPNITDVQKERILAIHNLLTPDAQNFIFKHELGHVVQYYSLKKLMVIFIIGSLSTYSGIITALQALQIHGLVAIAVGMVVGGCIDLFLTYVSNVVFKLQEEKSADRFAVQYSCDKEVQAAADFFKQHGHILDANKKTTGFLCSVPSSIFTGYQKGCDRSAYLLRLLSKK